MRLSAGTAATQGVPCVVELTPVVALRSSAGHGSEKLVQENTSIREIKFEVDGQLMEQVSIS